MKALPGVLLLLCSFAGNAYAMEVAGVALAPEVTPRGMQAPLVLNGAGIRSKFFIKVYIAGLYLPKTSGDARRILESGSGNRVAMHFVYSKVTRQDMAEAWRDGFDANLDDAAYALLEERIERFVGLFPDLTAGMVVLLDYLPGTGTRLTIDEKVKGVIEGGDFNAALLAVWLGDEPVTESLKEALLGADT